MNLSPLLLTLATAGAIALAVGLLMGFHYLLWGRSLSQQVQDERDDDYRQALLADLDSQPAEGRARPAGSGEDHIQPPGRVKPA